MGLNSAKIYILLNIKLKLGSPKVLLKNKIISPSRYFWVPQTRTQTIISQILFNEICRILSNKDRNFDNQEYQSFSLSRVSSSLKILF